MNTLEHALDMVTIQAQQNSSSFNWDNILYPVAACGVLALFVFTLVGIGSVAKSHNLTGAGKFLWIVLMLCFPFIAPLVWFLGGKKRALSSDSGSLES